MVEYNSYPKNMVEITNNCEWNDYFAFCFESHESRQAYKDNLYEMHEDLNITWIKKDKNLGYCICRKDGIIKFYKIGTIDDWNALKEGSVAQFTRDNS